MVRGKVMTAYTRGRAFEYRVRDALEREGWFVVRQARSSFPDLIAMKANSGAPQVLMVECKVNGYISPVERKLALELAERTGAKFLLAYRKGRKLLFRGVQSDELGRGGEQVIQFGG